MLLVCIRHLPTAWNQSGRLQGRRDTDLVEIDETTASAIRANQTRLEEMQPFDTVLASALKRTQQTAALYGYRNVSVEPLLDELDFGPYEGQPKDVMVNDLTPDWQTDPRSLVLGEPISQLEKRILKFLDKYSTNRQVLIFGHGSWIRGLLSVVEYGDVRAMNTVEVDNNSLVTIGAGDLRSGSIESKSKSAIL